MATGVRIKLNPDGMRQALQSEPVQALLLKKGEQIAEAAGDGFEVSVKVVGGSSKLGRAMGYVRTGSPEARKAQARDNSLQHAVNGARQ